MASAGRGGRTQRPYRTSWGEDVSGLYRCPDGRWRINATGAKFTEADERRAIARFRAQERPAAVPVPSGIRERFERDEEGLVVGPSSSRLRPGRKTFGLGCASCSSSGPNTSPR